MRICNQLGCGAPHLAKGLCRKHYLRTWKNGSAAATTMRGLPAFDRVMARVSISSDGCWIFTGTLTQRGYGHIRSGSTMLMAHRVTYENQIGAIPIGMELDHKCRCRSCVNPAHLEPVTHRENVRRGNAGSDWPSRPRRANGQFSAIEKELI